MEGEGRNMGEWNLYKVALDLNAFSPKYLCISLSTSNLSLSSLLHLASGPYWGFRRREVQPLVAVHPQRVQPGEQEYDWRGVCDQEHQDGGWEGHQGADLGHGGTGRLRLESVCVCAFFLGGRKRWRRLALALFVILFPL